MDAPRCRICGTRHWLNEPCKITAPPKRRRISKAEKEFHERREAREAKMLADWLADHPGRTVEDAESAGGCTDTDEGQAAWIEWSRKRYGGRDALDTPSGPMLEAVPQKKPRAKRGTFDRAKYHKEYMRKYMRTYLPKWRAKRRHKVTA